MLYNIYIYMHVTTKYITHHIDKLTHFSFFTKKNGDHNILEFNIGISNNKRL